MENTNEQFINRLNKLFNETGKTKIGLAKKFWPDCTTVNQRQNISSLLNGRIQRIEPGWITEIINYFEITYEKLFDYEK